MNQNEVEIEVLNNSLSDNLEEKQSREKKERPEQPSYMLVVQEEVMNNKYEGTLSEVKSAPEHHLETETIRLFTPKSCINSVENACSQTDEIFEKIVEKIIKIPVLKTVEVYSEV
jgi:hypothetical protein